VAVSGVLGQPRRRFSRHVFRGGNFFMPGCSTATGTSSGCGRPAQELDTTARRTRENLQTAAARVAVEGVRARRTGA
jgi:hypothetical protein